MSTDIVRTINQLMATGDYAGAQKRIRPLAKKEPRNPGLQNMAGLTFAQGGQHRVATPYFAAAVKANPADTGFRCNLALSLLMSGETAKAASQIDRLLTDIPDDPRPWHYRTMLMRRNADHPGTIAAASETLSRASDPTDALMLRSAAYVDLQNDDAALNDLETASARSPSDVRILKALALQLSRMGQQERALGIYRDVLTLAPQDPFSLSRVASLAPTEELNSVKDAAKKAIDQKPARPDDRAHLTMALARVSWRRGNTAGAMSLFTEAQAIDARHRPWRRKNAWRQHARLTSLFPAPQDFARPETEAPVPVFITGLPRSGTTLVEMILSMSPEVIARGELSGAQAAAEDFAAPGTAINAQSLRDIARSYRDAMPPTDGAQFFTDKMPANFRFIGMLAEAFPNARFIDVQRDPRDVALSMWMRKFNDAGMNYACRLEDIADQANLYRSYMKHWMSAYQDRILPVRYETLIEDMEGGTRAIAAHCGVNHAPQMLHPEQSEARVSTASIDQVRRKVHAGSVGRWPVFGDLLPRLTDALDPELWPELSD